MNVLSLFAGIGGLELGLERAGMTTVGQVEIDPFCRQVLAKHWPEVPRHDDVRTAVEWWTSHDLADSECRRCQAGHTALVAASEATSGAGIGRSETVGRGLLSGDADGAGAARGADRLGADDATGWSDFCVGRPRVDVICGGFPCQDISNAGRRAGIGGERSGLWTHMARTVRVLRPRYVVMENVSALLVRELDVVAGDLAEIGYDLQWDCIPAAAVGAPHRRDRWWAVAYPQEFSSQLRTATGQRLGRPASRRSTKHLAHANRPGLEVGNRREDQAGPFPAPVVSRWWAAEPDVGRSLAGFSAWLDRSGRLEEAHKLVLAYANAEGADPCEAVREMRDAVRAEADEWAAGGRRGLPAAAVLFAFLCELTGRCELADVPLASTQAHGDRLRELRLDEVAARPPLRRGPDQQRTGQSPDALHALSQHLARAAGAAWAAYRRTDAGATAWGWEDGLARVANGISRRVDRLRALGNAVVPQVAEHVGRLVMDFDAQREAAA